MTAAKNHMVFAYPTPEAFKATGLTADGMQIPVMAKDILERLAIFDYKRDSPCLWIVFLGGTGTGKSTLFNALCKTPLSATGVERPKTAGPVARTRRQCLLEKAFPFSGIHMDPVFPEEAALPRTGKPGQISVVVVNGDDSLSHLVLVDTPDLDSVEETHHAMARDLYSLADGVVFVASQEKYADEVLHDFFLRVLQDEKPYFFILNKASDETTREEILNALKDQRVSVHGANLWLIPHTTPATHDRIAALKPFNRMVTAFFQAFNRDQVRDIKSASTKRVSKGLKKDVARLKLLLDREAEAVGEWLDQLQGITEHASTEYVQQQRERFSKTSGQYLRNEIRKLFSRYDLLAKPRRAVRAVFKVPLKLMGFSRKRRNKDRGAELAKVRENVAFFPIQEALAKYNLSVLENLSPSGENTPLYKALRDPHLALTETEIRKHMLESQAALAKWLEDTFDELAKGIPTGKKVGIYSTSILWGILILTFEVVVGGGFTMLDAALDSALAPFVTKGAVEIFAYHEIRKVAKELASRYQEGLLAILRRQEGRYRTCILALTTAPDTRKALDDITDSVLT